jgi:hypothetical protein
MDEEIIMNSGRKHPLLEKPPLSVAGGLSVKSSPCFLTNAASHYRITVALSKRRVAAATPGPVASSQTNVREQSRKVYLNGNIITIFGV